MELRAFTATYAAQGREAFLAAVRAPGLVGARLNVEVTSGRSPVATISDGGLKRLGPCGVEVHLLHKREGANPFAAMVTIGRASNNDVVLEDPGVSKFHAYVRASGAEWLITDAGSLNGTFV